MPFQSILPPELLEQPAELPPRECIPWAGGFLEGVRNDKGQLVIQRLLSTDPADYLDPRLSPGSLWEPSQGRGTS